MADGGWASRTAERRLREEMVMEGMDWEARARSEMRKSSKFIVSLHSSRERTGHTDSIIQKHQHVRFLRLKTHDIDESSSQGRHPLFKVLVRNLSMKSIYKTGIKSTTA